MLRHNHTQLLRRFEGAAVGVWPLKYGDGSCPEREKRVHWPFFKWSILLSITLPAWYKTEHERGNRRYWVASESSRRPTSCVSMFESVYRYEGVIYCSLLQAAPRLSFKVLDDAHKCTRLVRSWIELMHQLTTQKHFPRAEQRAEGRSLLLPPGRQPLGQDSDPELSLCLSRRNCDCDSQSQLRRS